GVHRPPRAPGAGLLRDPRLQDVAPAALPGLSRPRPPARALSDGDSSHDVRRAPGAARVALPRAWPPSALDAPAAIARESQARHAATHRPHRPRHAPWRFPGISLPALRLVRLPAGVPGMGAGTDFVVVSGGRAVRPGTGPRACSGARAEPRRRPGIAGS